MSQKTDLRLIVLGFFLVAIAMRLMPSAYNFEAVGALGLFVGCFWSARMGILISLSAMAVSDLLGHWLGIPAMGSYELWLLLVVYAAMALSGVVGKGIGSEGAKKALPLFARVPAGALIAAAIFFLLTNFACWLDPRLAYEMSLAGLFKCYLAALPFAKATFIGNLAFSAVFFGVYAAIAAPRMQQADA